MYLNNKRNFTTTVLVLLFLFFMIGQNLPLPFWTGGGLLRAEASGQQPLENLQIGDRVVDNSWQWEFRTGEDYFYQEGDVVKPVVWIVVAKDHYDAGSGVTLLSEDLIGIFAFDNSTDRGDPRYGSNHWGSSGTTNANRGLRPWLNSTGIHSGGGFYQAFSDSFKNAVVTTTVPNREWYGGEFYTTEDNVFIPSIIELGDTRHESALGFHYEVGTIYTYFAGSENKDRMAQLGGENWNYWARTPSKGFDCIVFYIQSISGLPIPNGYAADRYYTAVRPALNLKSRTSVTATPNAEGIYEIMGVIMPEDPTKDPPDEDKKTGTHEVAYVPVKYKGSGRPSPNFTIENLITRAGMVSHYYYQQSYGAVSIESDFIFNEWEQLPFTLRDYKSQAREREFSSEWWLLGSMVMDDAIDLAGIDINDYDAVVVIQPADFKDIRPMAFLDTGLAIVGQKDNYGTWAHEIGHAIFKWPDFYEEKGRDNTRGITGNWSLMGSGNWLSPPAPIMSYNKVNNGWLQFKDLTLLDEYPKNIKLLEDLSLAGEVYRYNTGLSNPSYIILEGRKPTDGIYTTDPWYSGKRNLVQEEGVLLYNLVQKDNTEYVYVQELYGSTDRISLVPGESYDCDLCNTSFAVLMKGTELQIDIQPLTVTSRTIIQLSNIDYQYSSKNIAAAPNIAENQFDIDLKVYTSDGSMVGMCYDTNRYVIEIPGARSSGNVLGGGPEWISVPDDIEIYYEVDTTLMEIWLDELILLGEIDAEFYEKKGLEIEATIQEIVVDEHGERNFSEVTETLNIVYNKPLEGNVFSEGINFIFIIFAIVVIVIILISLIIRGIMHDRAHYKKR